MKKILIIDDDIMTLRMLKKCLEDTYEVLLENAGYRFVEHVSDYKVDMILLDIEMPIMNGFDVFDKYLHSKHDNIPVVFLSGVSDPAVVRDAIEKGAAGYLYKSSPKKEMLDRLEKIYAEYMSRASTFHVLVVGNDIEKMKNTSLALESAEFKVNTALSLSDAVLIIKRENVDGLVVTDKMCASDEKEVFTTIESLLNKMFLKENDETWEMPVIFGSDYDSDDILLDKAGKIFV